MDQGIVAGAAMAFSSVGVVGSALPLRRWRPEAERWASARLRQAAACRRTTPR